MRKRNYLKAAFVGGQLITGADKTAVQDCLVVIEEGKIVFAGEQGAADAPDLEGYQIIDISGKTLMPGIIDAHLHLSGNLNDNDSDWVREPVLQ